MYITKHKIDEFNSVISLSIFEEDYSKIVKKRIKKYRKKTFLPGFRKGRVPKEYIREIYEEKLTNYEVKKILKKVIQASIYREDILGKAITLGANRKYKDFFFKFYITFPPKFKIDFKKINTPYKILLEEKEVYKKIKSIQRKFGISEYKRMDQIFGEGAEKKIGKYSTGKYPKKFLNAHIMEISEFLDEFNSEISEILLSSYDSKVDDYLYNDIMLEKLVEKTLFKFTKDFIHRYMNSYYTEYMDNKDKYLNKKKEIEHFFRFQLIENKLVNDLKIFMYNIQILGKKRKKFLRLDEFQSLDFFFLNAYFSLIKN